jgi:hypothetical protein
MRGEIVHESCPKCSKFLQTVAIPPKDITVRLIITVAEEPFVHKRAA